MFHNIDPTLAYAFILIVLMVAMGAAGAYIAEDIQRSLEEERNADREKLARDVGVMIDTNHR